MIGWLDLLGLTLLHFVWQGILVAAVLGLALAALRRHGPEWRYAACCAAMVTMVVLPIVTFVGLSVGPTAESGLARLVPTSTPSGDPLSPLRPLLPSIASVWLCGVGMLQIRTAYWWLCMQNLRRRGTSDLPATWARRVHALQRQLGIRRTVPVLSSSRATVPMVIGWLRPVVLVPTRALTGLDEDQLRAVIAHELAHVRRLDPWVNLIQIAVETALFYHPAVWWVSRRLRDEREYCCDDLAVRTCADRRTLARALSRLECLPNPLPVPAATGGSLMQRIERLIDDRQHSRRDAPALTAGSVLAIVLTVGLLTTGWAVAADRPAPTPPRAPEPVPSAEPVLEPTPPEFPQSAEPVIAPTPPRPAPAPPTPPTVREPLALAPDAPATPQSPESPAALPAPPAPPTEPRAPLPVLREMRPVPEFPERLDREPGAAPRADAPPEPRRPVLPLKLTVTAQSAEASIKQQIEDIRAMRRELEQAERKLVQILEQREAEAPAEAREH